MTDNNYSYIINIPISDLWLYYYIVVVDDIQFHGLTHESLLTSLIPRFVFFPVLVLSFEKMRFDFAVFYVNVVTSVSVFSQTTTRNVPLIPSLSFDNQSWVQVFTPSPDNLDENLLSWFSGSNMAKLGTYAKGFEVDMSDRNDIETVEFRLQMANTYGTTIRGCGFYLQVDGDKDGIASLRFPASQEHNCGSGTDEMRTTSYGDRVAYDKRLRLPSESERAKQLEVHADGYRRTYVDHVCVGMHNERKTEYRSMCVNSYLLDKCAELTGTLEYGPLSDWKGVIPMSKSTRGVHKIVFRNLDFLVDDFQRLVHNASDIVAGYQVCSRISFSMGEKEIGDEYCEARHVYNVRNYRSVPIMVSNRMKSARVNPDNCVPVS